MGIVLINKLSSIPMAYWLGPAIAVPAALMLMGVGLEYKKIKVNFCARMLACYKQLCVTPEAWWLACCSSHIQLLVVADAPQCRYQQVDKFHQHSDMTVHELLIKDSGHWSWSGCTSLDKVLLLVYCTSTAAAEARRLRQGATHPEKRTTCRRKQGHLRCRVMALLSTRHIYRILYLGLLTAACYSRIYQQSVGKDSGGMAN